MIEFDRVSKYFQSNTANQDVTFSIDAGTIHGIVGENGAGKSTIMKIFYGILTPDSGAIRFQGETVRFRTPRDAITRGIGMVHQHFKLVPALTAWENILLGDEQGFWISESRALGMLSDLAKNYGINFSLSEFVSNLSVGQRQQVEILKLLYRKSTVLILDEPTAVLTPQETHQLFEWLRRLRGEGKTVVIITHKLHEVLALTDNVTVMRRGAVVDTRPTASLNPLQLAELIMGAGIATQVPRISIKSSEPILEFGHVSSATGPCPLRDVSFAIGSGEILGVAGISGNGQEALVDAIAGLTPLVAGEIFFKSKLLCGTPYQRRSLGIGMIPCDRLEQGLVSDFSLIENSILGFHREPRFFKHHLFSEDSTRKNCLDLIERYAIHPDNPEISARSLSGGNQQKLLVGRELSHAPRLVVAAYPTRGVDIGSTRRIHDELIGFRNHGCGVLVISAELEEILALSDRILVLYQGRAVALVASKVATEVQLGLWMLGAA